MLEACAFATGRQAGGQASIRKEKTRHREMPGRLFLHVINCLPAEVKVVGELVVAAMEFRSGNSKRSVVLGQRI